MGWMGWIVCTCTCTAPASASASASAYMIREFKPSKQDLPSFLPSFWSATPALSLSRSLSTCSKSIPDKTDIDDHHDEEECQCAKGLPSDFRGASSSIKSNQSKAATPPSLPPPGLDRQHLFNSFHFHFHLFDKKRLDKSTELKTKK